eukprot:TRINITY_DN49_c0_g1_i2.p1 TRINITY_DN49_c0_g1~~TRINITY_DN49_c0_g1_i2.p1  ORF type:complete len:163 (-),score=69.48 TRINITY_DN49_c0_g1_i2:67-555(-)
MQLFFFNDTATTEIYTEQIVGSVRCVQETANIPISDECLARWLELKKDHKLRYVIYRVEGEKEVVVDAIGERELTWNDFLENLIKTEPRFIVFDLPFKKNDGIQTEKIIFINWCPQSVPVRVKMVHSSTKDSLKKKMDGIAKEVQATALDDLDFEEVRRLVL